MSKHFVLTRVRAFIVLSVISVPAFAATVTKVSDDALAPLREATVMKKIRLEKLPLFEGRSVIDLEEFQVWAPGAKVIIHGKDGVTEQDPPAMRFFRGLVNGDPESFAVFSVEQGTGKVDGLVATHDMRYAVSAQRRPRGSNARHPVVDAPGADEGFDEFLTQVDPNDEVAPGHTWECAVDKYKMTPDSPAAIHATSASSLPKQSNTILSGTQKYSITVEIETDFELYGNAGSNSTTLTNYVTNLTAAVSTIYARDLNTNVLQAAVNIYTTSSDPWTATDPSTGLNELGDYYHSGSKPSGRTTSSVVLLSGKNIGAGIAWEGIICGSDIFQGGHWAGPYAWCADIGVGGLTTPPNPNTTNNGVVYGMPSGFQAYWPLVEYAHEMGHNMGGHHTHCVAISDAERIASGFTDGSPATSASNFIDHCYATEGTGCYSGTNYLAGSQSTFKGTIMSYCHNVFSGGFPQSRFTFGQAAEPSHHELDDYMLRSLGTLGGFNNIVADSTATLSVITAPVSVGPSSTGNAASVTSVGGQTYGWSIAGGSITSATNTNAITFTAGSSGNVVLTVITSNSTRCSVTDSKTVAISSATYNPPTNVEAHAISTTQALVSWTAATGTPPGRYNVYRSADGVNYSQVGNSVTTSFTDSAVSTNKAYLYKVRSADAGGTTESGDSNRDLATIVIYVNPTLSAGSSTVQAVDLTQLRTAVDGVRFLYGIGAGFYTYTPITGGSTLIHAADINELRVNLNTAITGLGFASPTYTNGTIAAGSSTVQAVDFNELRNVMR